MKKEIMKCDKCKQIIDRDAKEQLGIYYEICEKDLPGWASIDYSMGRDTVKQVCVECFKEYFKSLK